LKRLIETGSTLVFRGVPKGQNVLYLNKYIQSFGGKVIPSVVLDPTLFTRLKTVQVPTVAYPIGSGSKLAVVRGLVNIDWMSRKLRSKDLRTGCRSSAPSGPPGPQVEPDLIEEMKRRAASIDWDKKKQAAIDRFWSEAVLYGSSRVSRESGLPEFDPTIVLDQDISSSPWCRDQSWDVDQSACSNVQCLSGTSSSMQASLPRSIPRFDSIRRRVRSGRATSLIATRVNVEQGWNGFSELNGSI
jgi:conjugal transfer pilus assembly protein TraW